MNIFSLFWEVLFFWFCLFPDYWLTGDSFLGLLFDRSSLSENDLLWTIESLKLQSIEFEASLTGSIELDPILSWLLLFFSWSLFSWLVFDLLFSSAFFTEIWFLFRLMMLICYNYWQSFPFEIIELLSSFSLGDSLAWEVWINCELILFAIFVTSVSIFIKLHGFMFLPYGYCLLKLFSS